MFTKVLIADDLGSITQGVHAALIQMGITTIEKVQYCDDAYLKVKAALLEKRPYDLVITDLSFKTDHRYQHLPSGETLSGILKNEHPELKVIIYSVEDRLEKVRTLLNKNHIDAYVCKGRRGLDELAIAVKEVFDGNRFLSPQVQQAMTRRTTSEIDDYDIELLRQLSLGLSQDEIAVYFKENNIKPASLSTIEKELQKLRIQFKAKNVTQLVATAKDLGLI